VAPDIMCVGKALAAMVPMGAVLASERVLSAFHGGRDRAFLHGHSFSGNPIGAALALEVLAIYESEGVLSQVAAKAPLIARAFEGLSLLPGVRGVRAIGMIGAADLADDANPRSGGNGYLDAIGWRVYDEARARGAYLRPLGSTIYVCPPLTIESGELASLLTIVKDSVSAVMSGK